MRQSRDGGFPRTKRCFNPCCIGLVIATRDLRDRILAASQFQSLLYWISHCDYARPLNTLRKTNVSILVVLD
ncbi:hypothetical protein BN874_460112 [Candidatus Contendobacter odensis Run_B_J11]|uniref:Uncharacterized protein n=1 Tax=Candidatus Contendobacter odensis Run_B_J11 TaxID=1400861 RepID=A0A7U7J3S6_9GAMM|nr:hypothetical protein BN874_460112 [Candidatus Contendobacter odensis Run_B_J11]